jgi:hypothetical protein
LEALPLALDEVLKLVVVSIAKMHYAACYALDWWQ